MDRFFVYLLRPQSDRIIYCLLTIRNLHGLTWSQRSMKSNKKCSMRADEATKKKKANSGGVVSERQQRKLEQPNTFDLNWCVVYAWAWAPNTKMRIVNLCSKIILTANWIRYSNINMNKIYSNEYCSRKMRTPSRTARHMRHSTLHFKSMFAFWIVAKILVHSINLCTYFTHMCGYVRATLVNRIPALGFQPCCLLISDSE